VSDDLDLVRQLIRSGEHLTAYDEAEHQLAEGIASPEMRYVAVLALARAGATERAQRRYAELELGGIARDGVVPERLAVDIVALDARLAKDRALSSGGPDREALMRRAASRYRDLFDQTRDWYPGINAASLTLLAGNLETAQALAESVLDACRDHVPRDELDTYYLYATEAEAAVIRGEGERALRSLERASETGITDYAAMATTRRQLRLVCEARAIDPAPLLAALEPPTVVHYLGHRIGPRFPAASEDVVRAEIERKLDRKRVGFAFGSLASGGDILFAEALLARGAELHLVFPFEIEEFARVSVAEAGARWPERFRACLDRATRKTFATEDEYLGDDGLFAYASRLAMGLTIMRARFLETTPLQMAVWDGRQPLGQAGTATDVALWKSRGFPAEIIRTAPENDRASDAPAAAKADRSAGRRRVVAMLFGDVKGFSKLRERQLPSFVTTVLGTLASTLCRYERHVAFRNTWGDGLYVVFDDLAAAAECALELRDQVALIDPQEHGLPEDLGLRLGGHVGPVFELADPVLGARGYFGSHVSRTARIEPVTPEGQVYVSEPFAAQLALDAGDRFGWEYVGHVQAAKGYGKMRMYALNSRVSIGGGRS
jgi:class 3 adenylate cyclase